MRTIKYTTQFKHDYKYEKRRKYKITLDNDLLEVIKLLIMDTKLPEKMCDHQLKGSWKDYRDCHIKPDLILIYRKVGNNILELVRLGSHSELGL